MLSRRISIESWNSDLVIQWLNNIKLGQFSTVLNIDAPFTGKELLAATVDSLAKSHKIDKKVAKKIIKARDRALAYLSIKPKKTDRAKVEVSAPFAVTRLLHVEFVPGKGLKGLPKEWEHAMKSERRHTISLSNGSDSGKAKRKNPTKSIPDFSTEDVLKWNTVHVVDWLHSIDLPIFASEFTAAGVDGKMLMTLTSVELIKLLQIDMDALAQRLVKNITVLKGNHKRSKDSSGQDNSFSARSNTLRPFRRKNSLTLLLNEC